MLRIILTFLSIVAAANPGATASLDFAALKQAEDTYFGYVLNIVNQVKIPNVSFHHGHLDSNTFHVTETSKGFQMDAGTKNSIKISANDLAATFHSSDLRYKEAFLTAKGSLDATISSMSVSVELGITTQTLSNGKVVPAVKFISSSCDLPKIHIHLKIHGNLISKFADLFKNLFMGTVRDEIINQVNGNFKTAVPQQINSLLAQQKGETEVYNKMGLDWSIFSVPTINSKGLDFGIKGLFFPESQGEVEPPVTPPVMPYTDAGVGSQFQAFVSDYTLDSLATTFVKTNNISLLVHHNSTNLDTAKMGTFLPKLVDLYGNSSLVDMQYDVIKLENFTSNETSQSMSFNTDVRVQFLVYGSPMLDITLESLFLEFTAIIDGMTVKPNVTGATLKDIKINYSIIGNIGQSELQELLQWVITEFRVPVNSFIKNQTLVIPSSLFGMFKLSDLVVKYHDGYVEAGLTPKFLPIGNVIDHHIEPCYNYSEYNEEIIIDENGEITVLMQDEGFIQ